LLSKKTAVGIGIGCFLIIWGSYFLILSFGKQTLQIDEPIESGKNTVYQFEVQNHFRQLLNVTGNSFHVKIETPHDDQSLYQGLQVDEDFKNKADFEWFALKDGQHRIEVTNTGDSDVQVTGSVEFVSGSLEFAKHMLPIISGIIIIGISAVFSVRKPRGF